MRTVQVTRSIPAPAEAVFDLLADHANYDRFRPIRRSELLRQGDPPPNGVGAMRKLLIGPLLRFEEEITAYERPWRLEYLIVRLNAPYEHDGGRIRLAEKGGWTRVDWTSVFSVPTPLVGGIQERAWAYALARGFKRVLEDVERMLAGRDGA
jgi:uncharacterized protein YndB with AHSA1/START domain